MFRKPDPLECDAASISPRTSRSERGSILIAAVLFLFFVFLIAGVAVDVSRYYLYSENVQNVADGAALAGARALGQYSYDVDQQAVHEKVIDYIKANQGPRYADLYSIDAGGQVHDIHVTEFPADTSAQSCSNFSINNGSVQTSGPTNVHTEVLGTALEDGGGNPIPITARIIISDPDDPSNQTDTEPWGAFNDPDGGDMNDGSSNRQVDLSDVDEGMEIDVEARSWMSGSPHKTVRTGEHNAFTLRDGDNMFSEPGYNGQGGAQSFVDEYMDENGNITLENNQAIIFFELYADYDQEVEWNDKQDLVVLLSFASQGGGSGGVRSGSLPAWMNQSGQPCGNSTPVYRVGVPAYGSFEPLFLPESVFGTRRDKQIVKTAVAEVRPRFLRRYGQTSLNCSTYSGGQTNVNPGGLSVANGGSLCSNGNVNMNTNSPSVRRVVMPQSASLGGPGSGGLDTERFNGSRSVPRLNSSYADNASQYDVDMTQANYSSSFPDAGCTDDEGNWWEDTADDDRQLITQNGDPVVWQGSGNPVCLEDGGAKFVLGGSGEIVNGNNPGSSLTFYTDEPVQISGQVTLNGGVFSTSDIQVNGAGHEITGDPDNVGGLALWAQNNLNVNIAMTAGNAVLRGLVGAQGDVTFGPAGQNAPALRGLLVAGGDLTLRGNGTLNIIHDPSAYDASVLNTGDWSMRSVRSLGDVHPPMAEATVRLID